jgi:hypothetical protein
MGMIQSEKISGGTITVLVESSNIGAASYHTHDKTLLVTFKNNRKYLYLEVPWEVFTKFRMAESQGKFFSAHILKKYSYQEIKEDDRTTEHH